MPSIQIKNVPPEVHAVLQRRAADAHQSLQEYLRGWLIEETSNPALNEILDEIDAYSGDGEFSLEEAAAYVRADRDSR